MIYDKPPEGHLTAVVKNRSGEFSEFISSVSGWHFAYQETSEDPDDWEGEESGKWEMHPDVEQGRRVYWPKQKGLLEAEFGRVFRVSTSPTAPFPFLHSIDLPLLNVTCKGNIQIALQLHVVVRLRNPYKAMFGAPKWQEILSAAVHTTVRQNLSQMTVDEIRADKGGLNAAVLRVNEGSGGVNFKYGLELIEANFKRFELIDPHPAVRSALHAAEVNRLMADAAPQKAREIDTLAAAEASAAARLVEAYGSGAAAAAVRVAEHLAKTKGTVVLPGSLKIPKK